MDDLRVWAPRARHLDVLTQGQRLPMRRIERGWWERGDLGSGTRYRLSVDGGAARLDPRSRFQPEGVEGPSEIVDPSAFRWTDQRWRGVPLAGAVIYELHVGTFTPQGTFDAAAERMPYLVELGVDVVEVMPVAEFPGERGWGYDGIALYAPHHRYGGPTGLQRFVDACHAAGLGVVMDVVYNHFGPGNAMAEFGPYFSDGHSTAWGPALNFDGPGSEGVRRFVIDNALMWLRDYHVDGLRLDAVHAIVDTSALHILEELAVEVSALAAHLRKPLFLIAESDSNDPRLVRSRDAGGYGLDGMFADEWHHAVHAALTGESSGYYQDFGTVPVLAKALGRCWVHDGSFSRFRDRVHGRSLGSVSGHQLIVCTQNHDQVGNRALGERLSTLTTRGRSRIAAALLLTSPFTPMLFQGEEWGARTPFQYFTDHPDPELGRAVCEGRRKEFQAFGWDPMRVPDPQDVGTFLRSKLDWSEVSRPEHRELRDWYRALLGLRRARPEITDPRLGSVQVRACEPEGWLRVRRGPVTVVVNLSGADAHVPTGVVSSVLLASDPGVELGEWTVRLPPETVAILEETPEGSEDPPD
jgi:maltooligosyltrehalose trehalohydrolase